MNTEMVESNIFVLANSEQKSESGDRVEMKLFTLIYIVHLFQLVELFYARQSW